MSLPAPDPNAVADTAKEVTDVADVADVPVAIVGGGPAGLMAAETLSRAGVAVHLFDAMPSVGRKFLLAGRGGLNLTHDEPFERFVTRYGAARPNVEPWLREFGPAELRAWAHGLGVGTFVGTSGRVFPDEMKAAPLLRAWLHRLRHPPAPGVPVQLHMRHRWLGWDTAFATTIAATNAAPNCGAGVIGFDTPGGVRRVRARALLLALGGASWPRLGSDGAWQAALQARGVPLAPLAPANCGFDVAGAHGEGWSAHFRQRHAGAPLKSVALRWPAASQAAAPPPPAELQARAGEFVVTESGVEGSLIYAASADLRAAIERRGEAVVWLDLLPARTPAQVRAALAEPRGTQSVANHLRRRLGLQGVKAALLHELLPRPLSADPAVLAAAIKALPLRLARPRPVAEAISSAGGVRFDGLDEQLALRADARVFCAGEMLDWEAPTGGYLLTACLASGVRAARGVLARLGHEGAG